MSPHLVSLVITLLLAAICSAGMRQVRGVAPVSRSARPRRRTNVDAAR